MKNTQQFKALVMEKVHYGTLQKQQRKKRITTVVLTLSIALVIGLGTFGTLQWLDITGSPSEKYITFSPDSSTADNADIIPSENTATGSSYNMGTMGDDTSLDGTTAGNTGSANNAGSTGNYGISDNNSATGSNNSATGSNSSAAATQNPATSGSIASGIFPSSAQVTISGLSESNSAAYGLHNKTINDSNSLSRLSQALSEYCIGPAALTEWSLPDEEDALLFTMTFSDGKTIFFYSGGMLLWEQQGQQSCYQLSSEQATDLISLLASL